MGLTSFFGCLVVVASVGLAITDRAFPAPVARSSVTIAAPASIVWAIATDLPMYGSWNPFFTAVHSIVHPLGSSLSSSGSLAVGTTFTITVAWPKFGSVDSGGERVTRMDPPRAATNNTAAIPGRFDYCGWGLLLTLGCVRATRTQTFTAVSESQTLWETEEVFQGWLKFLVPINMVRQGFQGHGRALKLEAERRQAKVGTSAPEAFDQLPNEVY